MEFIGYSFLAIQPGLVHVLQVGIVVKEVVKEAAWDYYVSIFLLILRFKHLAVS